LSSFASTSVDGTTNTETDEHAIREVMDRFMDAWNRHDAKSFAAVFSEDADFTNVRGSGATGRAKIEAFHAPFSRPSSAKAIRNTPTSRLASCAPISQQSMSAGR